MYVRDIDPREIDPRLFGLPCPLCDEQVDLGTHDIASIRVNGLLAHRECSLRMAVGGIGHLVDHGHWCLERGDPDMGLSYRMSALAVDAWVSEHGIKAAVALVPGRRTP